MLALLSFIRVSAQFTAAIDSIAELVQSGVLAGDSLADPLLYAIPMKYEYVPAEETPELVADRLACLQGTIPLTYNNNVHGFVNFFTFRNHCW